MEEPILRGANGGTRRSGEKGGEETTKVEGGWGGVPWPPRIFSMEI
jgi:hypothetical protein